MDALATYGSDSDSSQDAQQSNKPADFSTLIGSNYDSDGQSTDEPPVKRRKSEGVPTIEDIPDILPPPRLLGEGSTSNEFASIASFSKDYNLEMREKLQQQKVRQIKQAQNDEQKRLSVKLDQMYQTFQTKDHDDDKTTKSFAAHLKSQHAFHNPHLLKDIISHFEIEPLQSNASNLFQRFEYVDRLMSAEERSRLAAVGMQGGLNIN